MWVRDAIVLWWKVPGCLDKFELLYFLRTGRLNSRNVPKRGYFRSAICKSV